MAGFIVWFLLFAAFVHWDHKRRMASGEASGFEDVNPWSYVGIALLCTGLFAAPLYFYATRKTMGSMAVGLGVALLLCIPGTLINIAIQLTTHQPLLSP